MQSPHPDSSEYADLVEHIGAGMRIPVPRPREIAPPALPSWAERARAMTQAFSALGKAARRRVP